MKRKRPKRLAVLLAVLLIGIGVVYSRREWIVEGVAATGKMNMNDQRITSEALAQRTWSLRSYTTVLFNHDNALPAGALQDCWMEQGALRVRIRISRSAPRLWRWIKDGTITGLSIAGDVKARDEYTIARIDIYEISIVSVPADGQARITRWYVKWF